MLPPNQLEWFWAQKLLNDTVSPSATYGAFIEEAESEQSKGPKKADSGAHCMPGSL